MGNVSVTVGTLALGGTDDARPPVSAVRAAIPGLRGPGMTAAPVQMDCVQRVKQRLGFGRPLLDQ
jgi:hypothetical protein